MTIGTPTAATDSSLILMRRAVESCLRLGVDFALTRRPGCALRFAASSGRNNASDQCDTLSVNTFGCNSESNADIRLDLDEHAAIELCEATDNRVSACVADPCRDSSTPRSNYEDGLNEVITRLRRRGGKVVISRTICGEMAVDPFTAALRYFEALPDTFGYLYHSSATGTWLGASPEVLLKAHGRDFSTMALAGTRLTSETGAWDQKNIDEHSMVVDFIAEALDLSGASYTTGRRHDRRFGPVNHLCTPFSGTLPEGADPMTLIDSLSPTPALAGLPRPEAIKDIAEIEAHERQCYGGYVALRSGLDVEAYVNLRCARIDGQRFCIYTGGGITAASDPASEWNETEAKSRLLLGILTNTTPRTL